MSDEADFLSLKSEYLAEELDPKADGEGFSPWVICNRFLVQNPGGCRIDRDETSISVVALGPARAALSSGVIALPRWTVRSVELEFASLGISFDVDVTFVCNLHNFNYLPSAIPGSNFDAIRHYEVMESATTSGAGNTIVFDFGANQSGMHQANTLVVAAKFVTRVPSPAHSASLLLKRYRIGGIFG